MISQIGARIFLYEGWDWDSSWVPYKQCVGGGDLGPDVFMHAAAVQLLWDLLEQC